MYRPSGEMASVRTLPLSVNLAIRIFCGLNPRGRASHLYAAKDASRRAVITSPETKRFVRWGFAGTGSVRAAVELALGTLPDLLSRFRRFRSAPKSAAVW